MNYNKSPFDQQKNKKENPAKTHTHVVQRCVGISQLTPAAVTVAGKDTGRWKGMKTSADFHFKIRLCKLLSIDSKAQTRIILITLITHTLARSHLLHFRNENAVKILSTRAHKALSITQDSFFRFSLSFFVWSLCAKFHFDRVLLLFRFIFTGPWIELMNRSKKKSRFDCNSTYRHTDSAELRLHVRVKEKRNHHT